MNEEMATVRKGLPGGLPNREAHRLLDGKSLRSDTAFSTVYRLSSISLFPVSAQPSLSLSLSFPHYNPFFPRTFVRVIGPYNPPVHKVFIAESLNAHSC